MDNSGGESYDNKFCIQSHSRDKDESTFTKGDIVEVPKVIFDKANVVAFKDEDTNKINEELRNRIEELKALYSQHSRVIKYVKRNQFLEARLYYEKYVFSPIVQLYRMKYTPNYYYLYLIHISNHVPEEVVNIIEEFYKVSSVEEIYEKTIEAEKLFSELLKEIEEKIS